MKDKALRREVNDRILESLKEKQRARKALKKEVNRLVSEINRMARIKVISWGKQQSIKEILTGYDLKRRQQKTMERRADLEKYLNENPEAVNDFHEDDVKFLGATILNDMTLGELQDLHRKVGEEYKQGRREYATWEAEKRERADGIQLGLLESLKKKAPKVAKVKKGTEDVGKQYKGPAGAVEKVVDWERSALLGPDRFFDWLDGGGTSYGRSPYGSVD